MNYKVIYILLTALALTSCSEFQKLLKSNDAELKYSKAIEYFNQKKYTNAQTLFEDVATYYRGTERSEDILNYIARCTFNKKDYSSTAEYYQTYIRNYPKGKYIIQSKFMLGHCYFLNAPDPRLDQTDTYQAINALNDFVDQYPESPYSPTAYDEIEQLYNKLAQKELYSAQLYYNLGTYLGNNYLAAATVAQNALHKYPGNIYAEQLSFIILQSKYQQVIKSFEELKQERAEDAIDECYNFLTEYPDSKYRKDTEKMQRELRKIIK